MKIATTIEQKSAVIDLVDRLSAAVGPGYTRGDLANLVRAARSIEPYSRVADVLDPQGGGNSAGVVNRARAVLEVVRATSADTLEYV